MALAAVAFAKAKNRRQMMACTTSIGPGAMNMLTAAGVAHVNRLPVLLLPGDVFADRRPPYYGWCYVQRGHLSPLQARRRPRETHCPYFGHERVILFTMVETKRWTNPLPAEGRHNPARNAGPGR